MATKPPSDISALYETYFLRDLTYTASGATAIAAISITVSGDLAALVAALENHLLLAVAFLVGSYALGLLLQEGLLALKIFGTTPDIPKPYHSRHALMSEIAQRFGQAAIRELERTIYLKHVGSALGSAFLMSSLSVLVAACIHTPRFLLGLIPLVPLLAICLHLNRAKLSEQNDALKDFAALLKGMKPNAG